MQRFCVKLQKITILTIFFLSYHVYATEVFTFCEYIIFEKDSSKMLDDNKRCLKLTDYNFSESNLKSKLKSHLDRSVYPRSSESISYIVFNQSEENYWTISLGNYGYELIIHKSKTKGDYIVWPNGEYSKTSYYGTFRDKKAYLIFFDALLKIKNPTKDIKRQIKYMQYSYPELKQLVESSQIEGEIVGDNKNKSEVKSLPPKTKTDEDQPTK